jgi:hypothetical protein
MCGFEDKLIHTQIQDYIDIYIAESHMVEAPLFPVPHYSNEL